jgi:DNA polymerase-3 subunit alpha
MEASCSSTFPEADRQHCDSIAQRCAVSGRPAQGQYCRAFQTMRTKRYGATPCRSRKSIERRSEQERPEYRERLDFEIDVITRMGFAGYF